METLQHVEDKAPDGTGYNDYPKGWREISEQAFAQSKFFFYHPTYLEFRQVRPERGEGHYFDAQLFWFYDKTGVAMVGDRQGGKVKYFSFGCKHEYEEISYYECKRRGIEHWGNCWHVTECKRCGHIDSHDSSD